MNLKIAKIKENDTIKGLLYTVVFFLIAFNPPIFYRASFTMLFLGVAFVVCIINRSAVKTTISNSYIKRWMGLIICYVAYYSVMMPIYLFRNIEHKEKVLTTYASSVGLVLLLLPVSFFLVLPCIKGRMSSIRIVKCMVYAGLIQSMIGILCYISPHIRLFFNTWLLNNSRSEKMKELISSPNIRNYGFAAQLYDNFGFLMALLAVFAIAIAFRHRGHKRFYLYGIMIAFVGFINARSSMVLSIAGMLVIVLSNGKGAQKKDYIKSILIVAVGVTLLALLICFIRLHPSEINGFLYSGIDSIAGLLKGEKRGYFAILFDDFLFFPKDFSFIIGNGLLPIDLLGKSTDVGYVQLIWQNGIIGLLLAMAVLLYPCIRLYSFKDLLLRPIALAAGVMIVIYMVKLNCFGYGYATVGFTTVTVLGMYEFGRTENDAVS